MQTAMCPLCRRPNPRAQNPYIYLYTGVWARGLGLLYIYILSAPTPLITKTHHDELQKPVVAEDLAHEIGTPMLWRVETVGGGSSPLAVRASRCSSSSSSCAASGLKSQPAITPTTGQRLAQRRSGMSKAARSVARAC